MGSFPAVPFSVIETSREIETESLLGLLGVESCGVEYQPIIGLQDQQVYAYEALARFYCNNNKAVSPLTVFQTLHNNPRLLGRTEFQLKWHQIAFAPEDARLFINLDPHALTDEVNGSMMELLKQHNNLVVELIENTDLQDSRASLELHQALRERGELCTG